MNLRKIVALGSCNVNLSPNALNRLYHGIMEYYGGAEMLEFSDLWSIVVEAHNDMYTTYIYPMSYPISCSEYFNIIPTKDIFGAINNMEGDGTISNTTVHYVDLSEQDKYMNNPPINHEALKADSNRF